MNIFVFELYKCFQLYNKQIMSITDKLSNPFLKPSPFRGTINTTNAANTSYYNYNNINQSKVLPYSPELNFYQTSTIKPTRDFEISDTDLNRFLLKNPLRTQSNLIDRYGDYSSYAYKKYEPNKFKDYEKSQYDMPINGNSRINFPDNKSDTGSANTFINKIYEIQEKQYKYKPHQTTSKPLINPFERKYLIPPTNLVSIPNASKTYQDYYPTTNYYTQPTTYNAGLQNYNYDPIEPKMNSFKQTYKRQNNYSSEKNFNQIDRNPKTRAQYDNQQPIQISLQKHETFGRKYDREMYMAVDEMQRQFIRNDNNNYPQQTYREPAFGYRQQTEFNPANNPFTRSHNKISSNPIYSDNQMQVAYNSDKNLEPQINSGRRLIKFDQSSDQQQVRSSFINMELSNRQFQDKAVKDSLKQYPMFLQFRGLTFHRINTYQK